MVAFLVACDDSASAENNEPTTLSSIEEEGSSSSSSVTSAGSVTLSSSSLLLSDEGVLSRSSSSKKKAESSSSEKLSETSSCSEDDDEYSSSSVILATPCKTETEDNCEYGTLLDDRDGQVYKTVKIGVQWWMAENLNFETENSWCGGGHFTTEGDCSVYGRLYTWAAAMGKSEEECGVDHDCISLGAGNVRGVCPDGWHVPKLGEWDYLIDAVGGWFTAGQKLKAQTGWKIPYGGITIEDAYGFAALPAGSKDWDDGLYADWRFRTDFWSATQGREDAAYGADLPYYDGSMYTCFYYYKAFGYSVRCVKD